MRAHLEDEVLGVFGGVRDRLEADNVEDARLRVEVLGEPVEDEVLREGREPVHGPCGARRKRTHARAFTKVS